MEHIRVPGKRLHGRRSFYLVQSCVQPHNGSYDPIVSYAETRGMLL